MELKDFNIFNLSLQQKKLLKKKVGQGGEDKKEDNVWFMTGVTLSIGKSLEDVVVGDYFSLYYNIYKTNVDDLITFSLLLRWDDYGDSIYPSSEFTISDLKLLLQYNTVRISQAAYDKTVMINLNSIEIANGDTNSFVFNYNGGSFKCTYESPNIFNIVEITRN